MAAIIKGRKKVVDYYQSKIDFSKFKSLTIRENTSWNYSYYPLIFETENHLLSVQKVLNDAQIFPRRYFYPSLNTVPYITESEKMPISESIASRILCLPLYIGIKQNELKKIVTILNRN